MTKDYLIEHKDGWVEIGLQEGGSTTNTMVEIENVSIDDALYRIGSGSTSRGHNFKSGLFLRANKSVYISIPKNADGRACTFVVTRS